MVHFFLYDYRFERVRKNPDNDIEKLSRYRAVLSPDISMYLEMAPVLQIYNVFRNRWCGAYWASKGISVIPSVNWGDESTFDFCFQGIEKGIVVPCIEHQAVNIIFFSLPGILGNSVFAWRYFHSLNELRSAQNDEHIEANEKATDSKTILENTK